jgi:hypothetical protein
VAFPDGSGDTFDLARAIDDREWNHRKLQSKSAPKRIPPELRDH